jgi:uncharacterized repeat protein (TIGR03803 family)
MLKTSVRHPFTPTLLVMAMVAISALAHAQTFSVLYNFGTKSNDPTNPQYSGIVAQGRDGNLYSAAPGGTDGAGAMLKITPAGALTVPYTFDLNVEPYGGLTLGRDGNYYGTTNSGGTANLGTVFKVTPGGKLTVLHEFTNTGDGAYPYAPPIEGADGNFYGTTTQANLANGTVYKITPAGVLTPLHSFAFAEGQYPFAPLVQGTDGNFYGTAQLGGTSTNCVGGCGTVFKITPSGTLSVLYNFDELHGEVPLGPLVQGSDGNFYGTTTGGGTFGPHCCGVIFQITPAGALTVLHDFPASQDDGINVMAGLVQATDGNLYGATAGGGANETGIIFSISPKSPYTYNILYTFDGTTGSSPQATMVQHTNGILYGDTQAGGTDTEFCGACGVFYSLNMGLKPFIRLVSSSGKVGNTVEILGQGFTGTTAVSFDGTPATFTVSSSTYLTAKVPAGALTGSVVVITPTGSLTSSQIFHVTPHVTSFTPAKGPVGTSVEIKGVSLTQATEVEFGSQSASFQINSDTLITATVPAGASTGAITITTAGGSATSKGVFAVTP